MINVDPSLTPFANVVALIVANNGAGEFNPPYELTDTRIEFGAVTTYSDVANPSANSEVAVNAILDAGYSGSVNISYYRPTFTEAATTPGTTIQVDTTDAVTDTPAYEARVKAAIAAGYGLREDQITWPTIPVPSSENNPETMDITPIAGSLLYQGAALTVTFAATDTDIALSTVITTTALSGFTF